MSDIAKTIACMMTFGNRWRTMMRESRSPADPCRQHVLAAFGDQDLARMMRV